MASLPKCWIRPSSEILIGSGRLHVSVNQSRNWRVATPETFKVTNCDLKERARNTSQVPTIRLYRAWDSNALKRTEVAAGRSSKHSNHAHIRQVTPDACFEWDIDWAVRQTGRRLWRKLQDCFPRYSSVNESADSQEKANRISPQGYEEIKTTNQKGTRLGHEPITRCDRFN